MRCSLSGIGTRISCTKCLVFINIIAVLYVLGEWWGEHKACKKDKTRFRRMADTALNWKLDEKNTSFYSYMDLDILMYMTIRNLERENNEKWLTVSSALRSATDSARDYKGDDKEDKIAETFYRMILFSSFLK